MPLLIFIYLMFEMLVVSGYSGDRSGLFYIAAVTQLDRAFALHAEAVVKWLKYCRYSVKNYPINQSHA